MRQCTWPTLAQTIAGDLLSKPMLDIVNWIPENNIKWVLIETEWFLFEKINLKMSSAKWRPFCLSLNVPMVWPEISSTSLFIQIMCTFPRSDSVMALLSLDDTSWFVFSQCLTLASNSLCVTCQQIEHRTETTSGAHFTYRQVPNIRRTKSQHLRFSYCLAAVFAESLEARC